MQPVIDVFITFFRNPEMAELVVESINAARKPRPIRLWGFFEYGFTPELEGIFDRIEGVETRKVKRGKLYGINWNTPSAFMQLAEQTAGEYVICLQSDIVISEDFFEFIDAGMETDAGYVFGLSLDITGEVAEDTVVMKCHPGFYGHWGIGVRTEIILEYYCRYFGEGYTANCDRYAKKFFPDIKCGGTDYFISRFLFEHKVAGIRPTLSRTTNIGIDGVHIQFTPDSRKAWKAMPREERLAVLRKVRDHGITDLKSNYDLTRSFQRLDQYDWDVLRVVDVEGGAGKHTGTDL